jgi:hypothetical protein
MADIDALRDQLTRLDLLPTIINWRGTWVPDSQYFQNDLVVSPSTFSTYILVSQTAIIGGGDPSTNVTDWVNISTLGVGVTGVRAGPGIGLSDGDTNPTISNNGVISVGLVINGGISNAGDAQNPILLCSDVQDITATEPSIGITQPTPGDYLITNLGIVDASGGSNDGLSVSKDDSFNLNVANTGLITVSPGGGITIDHPVSPYIPNVSLDGLLSVAGGVGITTTELNHEAEIVNDGVCSIQPGYGMVIADGPITTFRARTSRATVGFVGRLAAGPFPNPIRGPSLAPPGPGQTTIYNFGAVTGNIFADYMANGTPEPSGVGTFVVDMSAFNASWINDGNSGRGQNLNLFFVDGVTPGGPYYTNTNVIKTTIRGLSNIASISLGRVFINIAKSRQNGVRVINGFSIQNGAGTASPGLTMNAVGDGWATYYPQNIPVPS